MEMELVGVPSESGEIGGEWYTTNCDLLPAVWAELLRLHGPVRVGVFQEGAQRQQCWAFTADGRRCTLAAGHPGHPGLSQLTGGAVTDGGHIWEVVQP